MRKYDTVIFDLDGTLLNTLEDLKDAVNYVMRQNGYPERTLEEVRHFVGNGIRKLMERAVPENIKGETFERVFEEFRSSYTAHCQEKTCAYEGIVSLLQELKKQGIALAIVSNKNHAAVCELNEIYFKEYIKVAIGQKDGIRKKPAPDTVLHTGDRELQGLEKAVNDLMGRMRLSYQEQTRFVSDASHELRTPIAVIQGYADMLSRWGKDDPTVLEEGIAAIKSESAHMNKLIEQLLFLARGDSGRTRMTMENTDLSALVKEVHEEFGMIHPERNWRLQADTPVWAVCDYAMIKQTLRILTENAVKYTAEADTVTLRARMHKGMPALEVQDNGIGIAAPFAEFTANLDLGAFEDLHVGSGDTEEGEFVLVDGNFATAGKDHAVHRTATQDYGLGKGNGRGILRSNNEGV